MNKNIILLTLFLLFTICSCRNEELLIDKKEIGHTARSMEESYPYSAENGWISWKCNLVSGNTHSFSGTDRGCIEMFLNSPIKLFILNYISYYNNWVVDNPVVEDVAGIDVHAIECGEGYAVLYSFVSGEDLLDVWLEGQDLEHPFQIRCYVFDPNSYSLILNESKTTLVVSSSVQSRSIKSISSIEIMTYDKEVLFTQRYANEARNIGINISSFFPGKYIVKIKDDTDTEYYQRLIIE